MRKLSTLSLLLFLLSCNHPPKAQKPLVFSFVDALGRKVELAAKPQRVISFAPNITEMIYAIGAEDRLIGITTWCNYPPQATKSKEKVGDYQNPNWEKILGLKPDLVLLVGTENSPILSRLKALKIPAAAFRSETPQDIIGEIQLLGEILDRKASADSLSQRLKAEYDSLHRSAEAIPWEKRPRVFAEISNRPLYTGNDKSFLGQLISLAGGRNIASDMPQIYDAFNSEVVLSRKPDVILILHPGTNVREVMARPGWASIPAIRSGRVYSRFDLDILMRPGPRFVKAVEQLHCIFYENK